MANILLYNTILEETERYRAALEADSQAKADEAFLTNSYDPQYWTALPYDDTNYDPAREIYVCDTTGCWNCGASCTWTVPAGATTAMFQVWGSGGGASTGCCCGGTAYGATGGYVVAIAPVSEGDSYTLCAACANACNPARGYGATKECGSYVCGPDATLCAAGACTGVFRQASLTTGWTCCRFQAPNNGTVAGACICNSGGDWCMNGCATCGEVGYTTDPDLSYSATVTGDCVCGLPVMYGITCFDSNHYGYKIHPPVITPTHTVSTGGAQATCDCCSTFTSGTCCGGCYCGAIAGYRQVFGAGATHHHHMGGGNSSCGDRGRAGMVRVTWW